MPEIAVVVPVYNSAATLPELVARVVGILRQMGFRQLELILVDDASQDDSWVVIARLQAQHPEHIRGYRLSRNVGQHMATLCGLRQARAPWIFTIDDDLEHSPEAFPELWAQRQVAPGFPLADVVYAEPVAQRQHLARRLGSGLLRQAGYFLLGTRRWGTPFRLLRREALADLLRYPEPRVFLDVLIHQMPLRIVVVPIAFDGSRGRQSRYKLLSLLFWGFKLIWWFTPLPLYILGGLMTALLGLAVLVALGVVPAFAGPGTAWQLGIGGLLLGGLRIVAGYQWRSLSLKRQLSQYVVAEKTGLNVLK